MQVGYKVTSIITTKTNSLFRTDQHQRPKCRGPERDLKELQQSIGSGLQQL